MESGLPVELTIKPRVDRVSEGGSLVGGLGWDVLGIWVSEGFLSVGGGRRLVDVVGVVDECGLKGSMLSELKRV